MNLQAAETVTWIKVDRPTFDLVGLILSSLGLTAVLAGLALALGILLGLAFIRRRADKAPGTLSLHLDSQPHRP